MDSFLDRARGLWVKLSRKGLKNFIWTRCQKVKGSTKDPFLYLGLISVVLFSIISVTIPTAYSTNNNLFITGNDSQAGTFL